MDAVGQRAVGPGAILDGSYEIGRLIGRGGMASVYEGRALDSGRPVAIKILRVLDEEPEETRRRFFQEIRAIASLRHPSIVGITDFGVSGEGARYLVMERLRGHTLGQELRRFGPMPAERSVPRLLEALDAVEAAHRRGIVHSDLKPSNLFLRHPSHDDESLVVLDFGVAHRIATPPATRAGTPQYAPPELLLGHPTGPPTDVFQLGLVLAEMLTGQAVLKDVTTARQCLERLSGGPLPLTRVEPAFREVIATASATDPADRYRDVDELREAVLMAWLRHKGGPRIALIDGPVADDAHTASFEDGSLEAPAAATDDRPIPRDMFLAAVGVGVSSALVLFAALLAAWWVLA